MAADDAGPDETGPDLPRPDDPADAAEPAPAPDGDEQSQPVVRSEGDENGLDDIAPPPTGRRGRRRRRAAPATPPGKASRSDYIGCGVWALGFFVLVCISFAVGVVLRPEDDPTVDLARVGPADGDYVLEGSFDETESPCVTLFDADDEVTGQCGALLQDDPDSPGRFAFTSTELSDGTTVSFGPVPRTASSVVIRLADGTSPEVPVQVDDGLDQDLFWFSYTSEEPIEEGSTGTLLDVNGNPVESG